MAYSRTLSANKDVAFVEITGWKRPGVALSVEKIESFLEQLAFIGEDMVASKEGKAGEALYFIESELSSLLRSCNSMQIER